MKRLAALTLLLPLLFGLAGCHTPQIMQAKSMNIHRIALAAPVGAQYGISASVQGSVGSGIIGEALGVASAERAISFNGLVKEKFPAGVIYTEFSASLKRRLEAKGFQVVDAGSRPHTVEVSGDKIGMVKIPVVLPEEADAILVPITSFSYFASSFLAPFNRHSFGMVAMIDTRTNKIIFYDWIIYKTPDSRFQYASIDTLKANVVPAVEALHGVAEDVAGKIVMAIQ